MPKKDQIVTGKPVTYQTPNPAGGVKLETFVPYTLSKRGVKREIITPFEAPEQFQQQAIVAREKLKAMKDTALLKALGLAHYWQRLLEEGKFKTLTEIAAAEGMDLGRVSRIARLTQLAPDVIEICVNRQHKSLTLEKLARRRISPLWEKQRLTLLEWIG
ncbi:MAG: LacI family transcriptional regulator [Ottowia sp.]|nr:LacI family transcriptional regulator [Ottowia sp.]